MDKQQVWGFNLIPVFGADFISDDKNWLSSVRYDHFVEMCSHFIEYFQTLFYLIAQSFFRSIEGLFQAKQLHNYTMYQVTIVELKVP